MGIIAALICLFCILISIPYLGKKSIFKVLGIIALTCLGIGLLWWAAIPIFIITAIVVIARNLFKHSGPDDDPYKET